MKNSLPVLAFIFMLVGLKGFGQLKPAQDSIKSANDPVFSLLAQENVPKPPHTVQSPNASALRSYGEIAVSPYTGKAEINIDLHALSNGNVNIPISLHYDAAGVRPDVHPGWTGLNFSLSTHYAVTRTVKDGPDEFNFPGEGLEQLGYTFTKFINNGASWSHPDTIKKTALTISKKNPNDATGTFIDTEPDEYSFNAPGLSGKFYFGSDGVWKVQCDRPVKVERITSQGIHLYTPFTPPTNIKNGNPWLAKGNYMEHFQGFIITDEFGTQYTFGGSDMAFMEYSIDFFEQGADTWICNAWYLKSVVRHTGQAVNFTYERGDLVNQMYFSVYNKTSRINGGGWFSCENWSSLIAQYGPFSGKLISPIYLKEITAENFKVKFVSSESTELRYTNDIYTTFETKKIQDGYSKLDFLTYLYDCYYPIKNNYPAGCGNPTLTQLLSKLKWRKLDKIQVQNGSGVTIKEFELTYNNIATERLMLQKIQEKSGYNANKLPAYEFSYYIGTTLPGYCKSHTDHWGYNNGKPISGNSDFNAIGSYGSTFRTPSLDENQARAASLTQIKYPTGGITKFRFEQHKYAKEVKLKRWLGEDSFAANQVAGGLRIKEIHSYDPAFPNPANIKKYYYLASFNAVNPDTSATALSSGILGGKAQYYWPDYKPLPDNNGITVEQDIFSTQSVLPASENSMGSHIGYSQIVERSSAEGWTVRKFSNFDNGYRDEAPDGFLQPSTTPYQPYNNKSFMRGKELATEHYSQNGNLASKTTQLFNLVGSLGDYGARSVKTQVTFLCNTNNYVLEGTAYVIDVRKYLPIEVATYNYDQETGQTGMPSIITNVYWPNGLLDITSKNNSKGGFLKTSYKYNFNLGDAVSLAMVAKNIVAPPREVFHYTGSDALPSPVRLTTINYSVFNGLYLPQKVTSKYGNSASTYTDAEFPTYDARGNLLSYKEQNGPISKLEYYNLADIGKTDLLKKSTIADGSSAAQTVSYNYKPLIGVETILDPNAKTVFYDYDQFNRLKNTSTNNAGGPIRSSFCYNYAGQVVECAAISPVGIIAASTLVLLAESALPVNLIEFLAVRRENESLLSWSTSGESNSDRFEIQRSRYGKDWQPIGSVTAKGNSYKHENYSFRDQMPYSGENFYRLKMVDQDSTFAYSRIQAVSFDTDGKVTLFPNPLTIANQLHIQTSDLSKISSIAFYDASGKLVLRSAAAEFVETGALSNGLYIVQITYTDGSATSHRIVKQ